MGAGPPEGRLPAAPGPAVIWAAGVAAQREGAGALRAMRSAGNRVHPISQALLCEDLEDTARQLRAGPIGNPYAQRLCCITMQVSARRPFERHGAVEALQLLPRGRQRAD